MTSPVPSYLGFADQIKRLDRALAALEPAAAAVGLDPPTGQEWFDLLQRKLLAQLDLPPLLVVAIVGGTNIGKSVLMNNLAGEVAIAVSPLAAGTKHPVCLTPPGLDDPALLARSWYVSAAGPAKAEAVAEEEIRPVSPSPRSAGNPPSAPSVAPHSAPPVVPEAVAMTAPANRLALLAIAISLVTIAVALVLLLFHRSRATPSLISRSMTRDQR